MISIEDQSPSTMRAEYTVVEATEDQLEVYIERHAAALAAGDEVTTSFPLMTTI